MCLSITNNLLLVLQDAPKHIFYTNSRSSGQSKNDADTFFSNLHPLSTVIFATATVLAFVLFRESRFNFHCYIQRETTPTQKSAQKSLRLLVRKITKGIHSCKPASLNRPIQQVRWLGILPPLNGDSNLMPQYFWKATANTYASKYYHVVGFVSL